MTVCLGDEQVTQHCKVLDTDAFDIVIGTGFLRHNAQVTLLSLQRPYALHCDFGSGLFSVPLRLSGQKESSLRYVNRSYRTENYHLVRPVLKNGLASQQVDLGEVKVELVAGKEQHMMQLYCSSISTTPIASNGHRWGCAMITPHSLNSLRCLPKSPLKERSDPVYR